MLTGQRLAEVVVLMRLAPTQIATITSMDASIRPRLLHVMPDAVMPLRTARTRTIAYPLLSIPPGPAHLLCRPPPSPPVLHRPPWLRSRVCLPRALLDTSGRCFSDSLTCRCQYSCWPVEPFASSLGLCVQRCLQSFMCVHTPVLSNARHGLSAHPIPCRLDSGTVIWQGRCRQAPMPLCR